MMVFWWAVIIAILVVIVNSVNRNKFSFRGDNTAIEILKKRYAKGEIDTDEFERMKNEILQS